MLYTLTYEGQSPLKHIQYVWKTSRMICLPKRMEFNIIILYYPKNTFIEAIQPLFLYKSP